MGRILKLIPKNPRYECIAWALLWLAFAGFLAKTPMFTATGVIIAFVYLAANLVIKAGEPKPPASKDAVQKVSVSNMNFEDWSPPKPRAE